MKGIIMNYRGGSGTQRNNQMIIMPEKTDSSKDLVGKSVIFKTKTKEIKGKITSTHGNNGAVRALFEKGLPGQSITKEVLIE